MIAGARAGAGWDSEQRVSRTVPCSFRGLPQLLTGVGTPRSCLVSQDGSRAVVTASAHPNLSFGVGLLFQAGAVNKQGDSILCR